MPKKILHSSLTKFYSKVTNMKRGALIVLEGCDRCGKSTQSKKIVETLQTSGIKAASMNFPDRTTPVGEVISKFLSKEIDLPDKTIHLLFSANRWELEPKIVELLENGTTLVLDRYSYSGVAFSSAKSNMDVNWCWQMEIGLPKPDLVLFMHLPVKNAAARDNYGEERYETEAFQSKVLRNFQKMKDSVWQEIDANKNIENVHEDIMKRVELVIDEVPHKPIVRFTQFT